MYIMIHTAHKTIAVVSRYMFLYLALFIQKPHGIFPLVDDQLSIPQSSDKTFLEAVHRYNSMNDKFVVSPSGTSQLLFGVKHYAGQVGPPKHFIVCM